MADSGRSQINTCHRGGIGRRRGLKIRCPQGRAGSSPAGGTYVRELWRRLRRFPSPMPVNIFLGEALGKRRHDVKNRPSGWLMGGLYLS